MKLLTFGKFIFEQTRFGLHVTAARVDGYKTVNVCRYIKNDNIYVDTILLL